MSEKRFHATPIFDIYQFKAGQRCYVKPVYSSPYAYGPRELCHYQIINPNTGRVIKGIEVNAFRNYFEREVVE